MSTNILDVQNLNVQYGRISALKGVSVSVRQGEIVAILGANGAGKSTLMRTLAGLEVVRNGNVLFFGNSVVDLPAHRRSAVGIGLVPEGRSVFAPLTVQENLWLGLLPKGLLRARQLFGERIAEIFEIF